MKRKSGFIRLYCAAGSRKFDQDCGKSTTKHDFLFAPRIAGNKYIPDQDNTGHFNISRDAVWKFCQISVSMNRRSTVFFYFPTNISTDEGPIVEMGV